MVSADTARATGVVDAARAVVASVVDPELPMLTLVDLGVLRDVAVEADTVVVTLTPTYTGCPALATMEADVRVALHRAGFAPVEVRVSLSPAWSTDDITERGRRLLAEHGIAPPRPTGAGGPVDVVLGARPVVPRCPRCGSDETRELSRFAAAPCMSLHVCSVCAEPFDKVKEL